MLRYIVLPVAGFVCIVALWLQVEQTSLVSGLLWAAIGLVYLAWKTGGFQRPAPQYTDD